MSRRDSAVASATGFRGFQYRPANLEKAGIRLARRPGPRTKRIIALLSDGHWHRKTELLEIAGDNVTLGSVLLGIDRVAESDSGRWLCIPTDATPEFAPDENRRFN